MTVCRREIVGMQVRMMKEERGGGPGGGPLPGDGATQPSRCTQARAGAAAHSSAAPPHSGPHSPPPPPPPPSAHHETHIAVCWCVKAPVVRNGPCACFCNVVHTLLLLCLRQVHCWGAPVIAFNMQLLVHTCQKRLCHPNRICPSVATCQFALYTLRLSQPIRVAEKGLLLLCPMTAQHQYQLSHWQGPLAHEPFTMVLPVLY